MKLSLPQNSSPRNSASAARGQAAIEFTIIAPIVIALFLLMIKIALIWHAHHLTSQLSLEGASVNALHANRISASWMPAYKIEVASVSPLAPGTYFTGTGLVLATHGLEPPFTFLEATNDGFMHAETAFPLWEFVP